MGFPGSRPCGCQRVDQRRVLRGGNIIPVQEPWPGCRQNQTTDRFRGLRNAPVAESVSFSCLARRLTRLMAPAYLAQSRPGESRIGCGQTHRRRSVSVVYSPVVQICLFVIRFMMITPRHAFIFLFCLGLIAAVAGALRAQKSDSLRTAAWSPKEELSGFQLPEGFVIEQVASEAGGVIKPIDLSFDDAGRRWTQTAGMYPMDPYGGVNFSGLCKIMGSREDLNPGLSHQ